MFSSSGKCGAIRHPLFMPLVAPVEPSCPYQQQCVVLFLSSFNPRGGEYLTPLFLPIPPQMPVSPEKGMDGARMDTETRTPALCYLAFSYESGSCAHCCCYYLLLMPVHTYYNNYFYYY